MNAPRRTHRKRVSALHLSTDTTITLPAYHPAWNTDSDRPPDYPDSAEEADEDTDLDTNLPPPSPRRSRRVARRRQSSPSPDPYLDSLLARSVHALEMSNALLQSSISTQSSLSAVLASSTPTDQALEARARSLSSRIRRNRGVHDAWADDLDEITRGVEDLFAATPDGGLSTSLPSSSSLSRPYPRRPSLDLRKAASHTGAMPHLRLSPQARSQLVSPPPRALTQYVASSADPESIVLPSTIGLRAASSSHPHILPPPTIDKPTTPAYTMLSSLVHRSPRGGGSTERGTTHSPSTSVSTSTSASTHSHSPTPKRTPTPHRMTPPLEELSSSSDSCRARRTVVSLRKILDDQPAPAQPTPAPTTRAPRFLPRSPPPRADAGTSTATASISRLFTRGTHTSSARARSPPRHSSLKGSPTALSIPELAGAGSASSGHSTPKRISFAELPESYARERGSGSGFGERRRRRGKGRGKGVVVEKEGGGQGSGSEGGWWSSWLGITRSGSGTGTEDRADERMGRWSARGFGGMDEWAV